MRPRALVRVWAYGRRWRGQITEDVPPRSAEEAGRTVPVRLSDGRLRFYHRDDVEPFGGPLFGDDADD